MARGEFSTVERLRVFGLNVIEGRPYRIERAGEVVLRLGAHGTLRIPSGAFRPGTQVVLRGRDPKQKLELLARQVVVGPAIDIEASEKAHDFLDVVLPYDGERLAASGQGPDNIVCVRWDPVQRELHELRPLEVDAARQTIVVRTRGLSTFQPCTAGFVFESPEFTRNAADDTVAYASGLTTHVAGRSVDPDAKVLLEDAVPGSGWTALGWFSYEDVPLAIDDTRLTLRAVREGAAPYLCEFVVRRALPRKTIERPTLHAAGDLTVATDGKVWAATVLRRFGVALPIQSQNESFLNQVAAFEWASPTLLFFNVEGDYWESFPLSPDRHLENEIARYAIRNFHRYTNRDIEIDENDPEEMRYLLALERFMNQLEEDARGAANWIVWLSADSFRERNLYASPIVPCERLAEGRVGTAYVLSTDPGQRAAFGHRLKSALLRRYAWLRDEQNKPLEEAAIGAGRLFYEDVADKGLSRRREIVAENVWCAGLSMKVDVETGEPRLLALGFPDHDPLARNADTRNSALHLHRREGQDQWVTETLIKNQPIVAADFVIGEAGVSWVVAAKAEERNEDLNGELLLVSMTTEGVWQTQPLRWQTSEDAPVSTLGMWPKVALDSRGRLACAFIVHNGTDVRFMIAREDGAFWKAAEVARATVDLLTGVIAPPVNPDVATDVVTQSQLPFSHWTPALATGPQGLLWYAYGDGVLHLASIDAESLQVSDRVVDVDRALGFFPSLTLRESGAPLVCAKDFHGFREVIGVDGGPRGRTVLRPALHFFALGQSHLVPREDNSAPAAPGRHRASFSLVHFGEKAPVMCSDLRWLAGLALFGPKLAARGSTRIQANLFLNHRIDIIADAVHNTVTITFHLEPSGEAPEGTIGNMTLVITETGNRLFISDAAGNEQNVCGIGQEDWDAIASTFLDIDLDPTQLFPQNEQIDIYRVEMRGLRIRRQAVRGVGSQQGAIRFSITVPNMRAEGSHTTGVGFTAVAVEPSVYAFDVAPYIVNGKLNWYLRSVSGRYGRVDVDADTGVLTWIGVIGAVLTGNPLFLSFVAVDPALDSFGANLANEALAERGAPPFGGFASLISKLLAKHMEFRIADDKVLTEGTDIEATFLSHLVLTLYLRRRPRLPQQSGSNVSLLPDQIVAFGATTIGGEAVKRNVLFINHGSLPAWFEGVRVYRGADFVLAGPPSWPAIVASGGDALIRLEFAPRPGSTGLRAGRLEVTYNGGQTLFVDLSGVAHPPERPRLFLMPERLHFGVVTVGSKAQRGLNVRNEGGAQLDVDIELLATGASVGQFAFIGNHPQKLAPGESANVDIEFIPTVMLQAPFEAQLRIRTNDPDRPEVFLPLIGQGAAAEILVQPSDIVFNDAPLASVLPPDLAPIRNFVIYNLGAATLTLAASSFEIRDTAGGNSPDFALEDAAGAHVPVQDQALSAGGYLPLSVVFRPQTLGDNNATITITYSGAGTAGSVEIQIRGRGVE